MNSIKILIIITAVALALFVGFMLSYKNEPVEPKEEIIELKRAEKAEEEEIIELEKEVIEICKIAFKEVYKHKYPINQGNYKIYCEWLRYSVECQCQLFKCEKGWETDLAIKKDTCYERLEYESFKLK